MCNCEVFKIARNKVHTVTKNTKCIYYQNQFGNNLLNKDFWYNLRNIRMKKKNIECNFDPKTINNTFSSPVAENPLSIEAVSYLR